MADQTTTYEYRCDRKGCEKAAMFCADHASSVPSPSAQDVEALNHVTELRAVATELRGVNWSGREYVIEDAADYLAQLTATLRETTEALRVAGERLEEAESVLNDTYTFQHASGPVPANGWYLLQVTPRASTEAPVAALRRTQGDDTRDAEALRRLADSRTFTGLSHTSLDHNDWREELLARIDYASTALSRRSTTTTITGEHDA